MSNIRTICQEALREISGITVPGSYVGNANLTAVLALACANRAGRTLAKTYRWQALSKTHTFTTSSGIADYSIPSDYSAFANLTFWDRTNLEAVQGPVSPAKWESLRSGNLVAVGYQKYFRVAANLFSIYPTPDASDDIAYQYYTRNWVDGGTTSFEDDTNEPLLDSDLITLEVKWRFRKAKGLEFAEEKKEAMDYRDALLSEDGGKDMLRFYAPPTRTGGIPETNFGS